MKNSRLYIGSLLTVGVVVLINLVGGQYSFRLDFTKDQRYTLSEATEQIMGGLEEPVTITAYFTEGLPPIYDKARTDFKEMLIEYANLSNGMIVYEFIDPLEDEEIEQQAMQSGVGPVLVQSQEGTEAKQQKAYLGAVIQLGEETEVLPVIQPEMPLEYALTTAIKKMSAVEKPSIGIIQGHAEPSLAELGQLVQSMGIMYNPEAVTLGSGSIDAKYRTLLLWGPKDSIPQAHLRELDDFLGRGGKLVVALDRVKADLSRQAMGEGLTTGLESWLSTKGLEVEENFVVDANCGAVTVPQQGFFSVQLPFPYLPIISNFADHPITSGLDAVMLQFPSTLSYTGDSSLRFTPLLMTSEQSASQPAPVFFDIEKQWTSDDLPLSGLVVGGILSGQLYGNAQSEIVVFTDSDFGVAQRGQGQDPSNVGLIMNSVDYLTDDTGLIELRNKGISIRPLDPLEEGTKSMIRYLNFLLPVLLVVIYGIIRSQLKKSRRVQRMQEDYS